jgi:hypothetical protein
MDRRAFLGTLAGGLLAAPLAVGAQEPGRVSWVGFLAGSLAAGWSSGGSPADLLNELRSGLRRSRSWCYTLGDKEAWLRVATSVQRGQFAEVKGAYHHLILDDPAQFVSIVTGWLAATR